jgi:hypothetical protein
VTAVIVIAAEKPAFSRPGAIHAFVMGGNNSDAMGIDNGISVEAV